MADGHIMPAHIREDCVSCHGDNEFGRLFEERAKPVHLLKINITIFQIPQERAQISNSHRVDGAVLAVADVVEALADQNHQFLLHFLGLTPQDEVRIVLQNNFIGHGRFLLGAVQINDIVLQGNSGSAGVRF